MRPRALCAAMALTISTATTALANDSEFYGSGATVYPVANDAIAMETEDLTIRQRGPLIGSYVHQWDVRVEYTFRNVKDEKVTLQMGFPEQCRRTVEDAEMEGPSCKEPSIQGFTVAVDGKPAKVTVKTARKGEASVLPELFYDRAHTFQVTFAPGQTRTVVHSYRYDASITSTQTSHLHYILRTGSLWHGKIGKLHATVTTLEDFKEVTITQAPPNVEKNRIEKTGETTWIWALEGYEPDTDIEMSFTEPTDGLQRAEVLSAVRDTTDKDLAAMDAQKLRILRNTVYAVHGAPFKDADLREHFLGQTWYRPREDYEPSWLGRDDQKLVARIKKAEAKAAKGGR